MKTTMKNELPDEIIKKCCPKRNTTPFINWRKRMKHSGKVCLTSATGDMAWIRPGSIQRRGLSSCVHDWNLPKGCWGEPKMICITIS